MSTTINKTKKMPSPINRCMHIPVQDTLCIVFGALVGDSDQDQEFSHFPNPTCKLREKNSVAKLNTVVLRI